MALASAWVSYALGLSTRGVLDSDGLVDFGATAINMLEACSKAAAAAEAAAAGGKGAPAQEPQLGACLGGEEALACYQAFIPVPYLLYNFTTPP